MRSWTDLRGDLVTGAADARHLVWFRWQALRSRRRSVVGLTVATAVTLASATLPALHPEAAVTPQAHALLGILPAGMLGFLGLALVSAVALGGGRELLPADQAAIHPLSPTTDHLGALLLAPLNIAWMLQAWVLLGAVAWSVGPSGLVGAQLVTVTWLFAATGLAQLAAWWVEVLRRGPHGTLAFRALVALVVLGAVALRVGVEPSAVARWLPTRPVAAAIDAARQGDPAPALLSAVVLLVVAVSAVLAGVAPVRLASRRPAREEARAETRRHPPRRRPTSDRAALLALDRASVWRSVPLRRGLLVLGLAPGLVAVGGALPWSSVVVLPGLVVSGGALVFGVNAWCLDERGLLWRESLPLRAVDVFDVRARVVAEGAGLAALVTVALGSVRAGVPSAAEAWAVGCVFAVVTLQVVATVMSWSHRSPYAVSLRSARATPAPPAVMVGYSARLALSTTLTALVFSAASMLGVWWLPLALSVPFLVWSAVRLRRARSRWLDPVDRARVVLTVAA